MLKDADFLSENTAFTFIHQEATERLKIFSSYRKKMKDALSPNF